MPQPLSRATTACEDLWGPDVGSGRGWGSQRPRARCGAGAELMAAGPS